MATEKGRQYILKPVSDLDTENQLKLRDIRNEEGVRKWMYTDHVIGVTEHLDWINRLRKDKSWIVMAALDEQQRPLGAISLRDVDSLHKKVEGAFYLTENTRGGLGAAIEYAIIEFVFQTLELEKMNVEVLEGNQSVVKLHKKFLYKEEGFKRSNIVKADQRLGVHLLGLTKADWLAGRKEVESRYSSILSRYPVSIHWPGKEQELSAIDMIQEAREKNNLNWMNVLRLAMDRSPETTRELVGEIRRMDGKITELTDKLIQDL